MKLLDLFSGIGGFSLGMERAGFEAIAFCEIEEFPRKVLKKHWPEVPCYEDVRELTADRLISDGVGLPDVITGGFPCQDLSTAGTGAGLNGERSGLWWEIFRLVCEIRPKYLIMENSPELLNGWAGDVFGALASVGYDAEWSCIPARVAGAPHNRDRVWIVAYPASVGQSRERRCFYAIDPATYAYREADRLVHAFQRRALPFVCGGHDGIPKRVDRCAVKGLGNAVVPQIPEMIGRAIMESHVEHSS